jgi:hypothetical protein
VTKIEEIAPDLFQNLADVVKEPFDKASAHPDHEGRGI